MEKKGRDGGWPITDLNPVESLRTRQRNQVIHGAAEAAQCDKRVSMHTLRH
jgi:site-specific recombinase XerD